MPSAQVNQRPSADGNSRNISEPKAVAHMPPVRASLLSINEPEPHAAETGVVPILKPESENPNAAQDSTHGGTPQGAPTPAAPHTGEALPKPKILVVEDTQELAEIILAVLSRMDVQAAHEGQGIRALGRIKIMQPDVVLLDIGLPDTTGWKILEEIKDQDTTLGRQTVVVVITAFGDPANRLVGKLQGVFDYLVKPFTTDDIEQVVKDALKKIGRG
jgi:CheY-like chemotaxis protein